jgi:hypothetical protein
VKLMGVRSLYPLHPQPRERLSQLGVREAGPDDRAVQRLGQLPDLASPRRLRGRSLGDRVRSSTSVRRSSLISGGNAVAARKLVGMGGSSDTFWKLAISL